VGNAGDSGLGTAAMDGWRCLDRGGNGELMGGLLHSARQRGVE
jgi:hypothetical protein